MKDLSERKIKRNPRNLGIKWFQEKGIVYIFPLFPSESLPSYIIFGTEVQLQIIEKASKILILTVFTTVYTGLLATGKHIPTIRHFEYKLKACEARLRIRIYPDQYICNGSVGSKKRAEKLILDFERIFYWIRFNADPDPQTDCL